ncbi:hypothetical protein [Streptomyces sp. NEAU-H3]|uniref:hypothetical protein n=1 Tax=Streptomyces sp. NEAU-H3 TaxID=2720636 RepID=UPI00143BBE51|nr:hypothetical protein [Streptomyces sp. NEAU-H3]NJA56706.1 hypothetical protein [Streptomyces sp. NEAU-H3]
MHRTYNPADVLHGMTYLIHDNGLHLGAQFSTRHPNGTHQQHDICALAWITAEHRPAPPEFFTDEVAALAVIEASAGAMNAIRAISDALPTPPCETNGQPDYIEHVSNWAATPPIGRTQPPSINEVLDTLHNARTQQHAAA